MGDSTIQPTDPSTGRRGLAATLRSLLSAVKKWKTWRADTWVALVSAVVAVAALLWQGHVSSRERIADERQQLVALTTQIAEQIAKEQTVADTALSSALVAKLTVEGQAGVVLLDDLDDNGVAGYEYIEVARALEISGDKADAIEYYERALHAQPQNAVTRAIALRYRGLLYYDVGRFVDAHQDMMGAAGVFSEHLLETPYYIANSVARAYVMDAYYQLQPPLKSCSTAWDDMDRAVRALGSQQADSTVKWYTDHANELWWSMCWGSGKRLLKHHLPSGL